MSVPQLRFKDDKGQDFPAWGAVQFSKFLHPKLRPVPKPSGNYMALGIRSHFKGTFQKPDSKPEKIDMDVLYQVHPGDLIVNITFAWEGAVAIAKEEDVGGLVSHRFPTYIFDEQIAIGEFFQYVYPTRHFKYQLELNSPGGAGRNRVLNKKGFLKIECQLPSVEEQTKIANFLTAVDGKISQLTQKCELLKQYKKGVMQQIFSQELRFKDEKGQDFSAWGEKTIGDIFTFAQTNSFSRELLNYEAGAVKNIHYGDIHTKFKSNFKIENEVVPFINPTVDISRIPEECYCKVGDLVIADASEDYADVGKAIEIISTGNQKLLSGLHTYIARDFSNQMALGFRGYLMQSEAVRLQIKTLATGVSVLSISKGNLAKVKVHLPSKEEQTKIANFLTAIDDKIASTQAQLASAKQYKQGLLQQMFV
ncbi:MAG: restriction endonuclease subunit S [Gallionella sp.]|nr:restriction endonuclease subunit S [Gallionella sp.]